MSGRSKTISFCSRTRQPPPPPPPSPALPSTLFCCHRPRPPPSPLFSADIVSPPLLETCGRPKIMRLEKNTPIQWPEPPAEVSLSKLPEMPVDDTVVDAAAGEGGMCDAEGLP